MIYRFKSKDCPDADGRTPLAGELKWTLDFPLPDGGKVYVELGAVGMAALKDMLGWEECDDIKELRAEVKALRALR